jgi:hypothetical protein
VLFVSHFDKNLSSFHSMLYNHGETMSESVFAGREATKQGTDYRQLTEQFTGRKAALLCPAVSFSVVIRRRRDAPFR